MAEADLLMDSYQLARPFLLALDPERAHNLGLSLMRFASSVETGPIPTKTSLGELTNPLGLAAGYDKTGRHLKDLDRLGFGYLVAGTFTLTAWPGNPKPRVAREKKEMALVNALGFPNPGVDSFLASLAAQKPLRAKIVASISGKTIEDVLSCFSKVQPHVDGVELNLSSPNTPTLKDLREPDVFGELAQAMKAKQTKPTYLKAPPFQDEAQYAGVLGLIQKWEAVGFEGVTASNSLPVEDARMAVGRGGKSGPLLFERTKKAVTMIRDSTGRSFEINACGGISSPSDAVEVLGLGATTIQVFTAIVYRGPPLIRSILIDPRLGRPTVR